MEKNHGLTITLVFEAESANYGEGIGNISALKKMTRGDGNTYSYISRQAVRYNIVQQMGCDDTPVSVDTGVVQFTPSSTIKDYPEIDLFGYMKTRAKGDSDLGGADTRSAVVRLSNAISLEPYASDLDFLTNMGLAKRVENMPNGIAQSEIHHAFYSYTITIDLNRIGIDGTEGKDDFLNLPAEEKAKRVCDFLKTIEFLYRDIKGRRENLAPVFVIGGIYNRKCPYYEGRVHVKKNHLECDSLNEIIQSDEDTKMNTEIGYLPESFGNSEEIQKAFKTESVPAFFTNLCAKVKAYYG